MKASLVFLIVILLHQPLIAQVFQVNKLTAVINQCTKDSVQKTERLAALKFHTLINEYRKKNKIDTLVWDDVLWLAARNHSVWMGTNGELSHSEKEGTKNFTGTDPGDRYYYASNHNSDNWSGENALYNWNDDGATMEIISDEMAKGSFLQWKNSPGHDANMRAKGSRSHAVAFYLEPQGAVWATDLFSYDSPSGNELAKNDNTPVSFQLIEVSKEKKSVVKKSAGKKMSVIELEKTRLDLLAILESSDAAKDSKAMEKAAAHHAEYMANLKSLTHNEKKDYPGFYGETEKKRMMKASSGLYFFSQHKIQLCESIATVKADIADLDVNELASEIKSALDANKKLKGSSIADGYGLSIMQVKNQIKVYAVRLEGMNSVAQNSIELSDK